MVVYLPPKPLQVNIPDDLTVPQFIFGGRHPLRPVRPSNVPWLIEDRSGRKIGQQELHERTKGLAHGLKTRFAIGENDVVLIFSRNHVDYPVTIWAVHQLGGIISGANPDFLTDELIYQLEQTKAKIVVVHPEALETALSAARAVDLPFDNVICLNTETMPSTDRLSVEDLVQDGLKNRVPNFIERKLKQGEGRTKVAFLSFSSGTTGRPKAVAIPHYALIANVIQMATHSNVNTHYCDIKDQRFRPGDVAIGVLPLYHIYGLVIPLHYTLFCAMSMVVIPRFNFEDMLNSIVRHKISHLYLVPPQIVLLCKHPAVQRYDIRPYVRMVMSGAAPLSHEINQQLFEFLPDAHIGQAYGMTETCSVTHLWSIDSKRGVAGSSGKLLPGNEVRILKLDGTDASIGEAGEMFIKTPSAALCYMNNAQATKETFVDGWVRTGDLVRVDKNGEYWVLDRLKEIMKVKGFQVAPAELEGCLLEHKDVYAACVIGLPDDFSGEVPLAYVVLNADAARRVNENPSNIKTIKDSIIKHVADNKTHYKHLSGGIEFVEALPVSPSGKLLRRVLRDQAKALRGTREKPKL